MSIGIGVVIVTYNREKKLRVALKSFDCLLTKPEYIIVVNNASTDGTADYLNEWEQMTSDYKKLVITNQVNIGGSGGFHAGLSKAIEMNADWIWVSDDDAYIDKNAFDIASDYLTNHDSGSISAICGSVHTKGNIDLGHRRRVHLSGLRVTEKTVPLEEYDALEFDIDEFSYVGSIISKQKMQQVGITRRDYFIHYDDTEHSLRLRKCGRVVCIPSIVVEHDVDAGQLSNDRKYESSWQKYYDYRNLLDMYKSSFPKRYYMFQMFLYRTKALFSRCFGMSKLEKEILLAALADAKDGNMGINEVYKPGWKKA